MRLRCGEEGPGGAEGGVFPRGSSEDAGERAAKLFSQPASPAAQVVQGDARRFGDFAQTIVQGVQVLPVVRGESQFLREGFVDGFGRGGGQKRDFLHGKCNYTSLANTISMYAVPVTEPPVDRLNSKLKPLNRDVVVTGIYKDDDTRYSLQNLLKRQEEGGDPQ